MVLRLKNLIKGIQFRLSDLFLILAIPFGLVVFIESSNLMLSYFPSQTIFPFWLTTICFALTVIFGGVYLCLEFIKKRVTLSPVIYIIFIVLALFAFNIAFQPLEYSILFNDIVVETSFSIQVKLVHLYNWIIVISAVFVGYFIVTQRIASPKFIVFVSVILIAVGIFTFIYSLTTEFNNYGTFFSKLFGELGDFEEYAPKSYLPHRNVYGFLLEFTIFTCVQAYFISKRKVFVYFTFGFYLNLLLTYCKSGIILTTLFLIASIYFFVIDKYKDNKNKLKKDILIISIIVASTLLVLLILILSIPVLRERFIDMFKGGSSLSGRLRIWNNSIAIINSTNWWIGPGFGTYQNLLYKANVTLFTNYTYSSHSFIFSLLGSGGIVLLTCYLCLISICIYNLLKKTTPKTSLILVFIAGIIMFIAHSFLEDNYYLVIFSLIGSRIYMHSLKVDL